MGFRALLRDEFILKVVEPAKAKALADLQANLDAGVITQEQYDIAAAAVNERDYLDYLSDMVYKYLIKLRRKELREASLTNDDAELGDYINNIS